MESPSAMEAYRFYHTERVTDFWTGIKKWHAYAHGHSDCSKLSLDDPEWDPYFGSKLIHARKDYPHPREMKPMSADVRAYEDMRLMFA
ncbi:hypothetical protein diail_6444 [Diaporthe ilicicola]|nr:hypothetical protein diail_6444 [Diaporthe ilicicola]